MEILLEKRQLKAGDRPRPGSSANAKSASYRLMQINVAVLPSFAFRSAGVASGANGGRTPIDELRADVPRIRP
jgi:hypothetical protein